MGAAAYRRYTEQFTAVSMTGALEELYTLSLIHI